MQNLGKVLQKRRQELGLSQRELADLIGVSEMSISGCNSVIPRVGSRHKKTGSLLVIGSRVKACKTCVGGGGDHRIDRLCNGYRARASGFAYG